MKFWSLSNGMIKIGVIGCGYWGPNLIRNLSEIETCQLAAVCDTREDRLDYLRKKFNGVHTTANYKEVLESKGIDGVVIATPPTTHFSFFIIWISNFICFK